jgi:hypothetical protein
MEIRRVLLRVHQTELGSVKGAISSCLGWHLSSLVFLDCAIRLSTSVSLVLDLAHEVIVVDGEDDSSDDSDSDDEELAGKNPK